MTHVNFNPKKMKIARMARGMTMKELAEKANVSRQMVSYYESGKTTPSASSVIKLINALDFPSEFFSSEDKAIPGGATFFRSQSAATKKKRVMQETRVEFVKSVYDTLSNYVNFPALEIPGTLDKDIENITDEDIKAMANELREVWGIGSTKPIHNLIEYAEVNGFVISEANMSDDKLDAVSKWFEDRPFILLTSNNESAVRRNFNIAHEIGHLLLHESIEDMDNYSPNVLKNVIEKQANLFASHLLLPDKAFSESLISTNIDFYVELKKQWNVSIQAMVYKTAYLGLINDDQKLYLNKKISWNKWRKKEPYDNSIPIEKPTLLSKVYSMIIDNGVVNSSDLFHQLKLPADELSVILGIPIEELLSSKDKPVPNLRLIK